MTRELAIQAVLKLIGKILSAYGCEISRIQQEWLFSCQGNQSPYPDELSAILAGCHFVIGIDHRSETIASRSGGTA